MEAWLTIAFRNIVKNIRRSLFTIIAISLGFAAVNLFGGFTAYMYEANREGSIYTSYIGHIIVSRKGFFERERKDPKQNLITPQEIEIISNFSRNIPEILLVAPQMRLNGIISDGKVSTIFIAQGIVPSVQEIFARETRLKLMEPFEGKAISDDNIYGIGISKGLAKFLKLDLGSEAVIMGTTADGQMNALDVIVFNLFSAPSAAINDRFIQVPFKLAQQFFDTDGAHIISILLKNTLDTEKIHNILSSRIAQEGLDLDIKTWNELSEWYNKVKNMFDIIFIFLFIIVFIIVVMSVINTMSMAVLERTREIGTLRALGLKRRGVMTLFAFEGGLLGIGGIFGGGIISLIGWWFVYFFEPTWTPPGITARIPLQLKFSLEYMVYSLVFLILLCVIASLIPARKAAYQNVVDALGHV
jgi:putative ABC transport system permease protein